MNLPLESLTLEDWPFSLLGIAYGQGTRLQLEVLYSEHDRVPGQTQLRSAWRRRQDRRGVPLLVVVLHDGKAHVCGPSGEDTTVYPNLDAGQVERICQEALEQPSRQAALRALRDSLGSLEEDGLPGLRNEGFLASHELVKGVPTRPDWNGARDKARNLLGHTGKDLLTSLGFAIDSLDRIADVLKTGDRKCALAILLNEQETPESGLECIPGTLSPVSYALARADEEILDWVILLLGRKIRLYPVMIGVGVGRLGRTKHLPGTPHGTAPRRPSRVSLAPVLSRRARSGRNACLHSGGLQGLRRRPGQSPPGSHLRRGGPAPRAGSGREDRGASSGRRRAARMSTSHD